MELVSTQLSICEKIVESNSRSLRHLKKYIFFINRYFCWKWLYCNFHSRQNRSRRYNSPIENIITNLLHLVSKTDKTIHNFFLIVPAYSPIYYILSYIWMEYKICKKTMRHPLVERMQGRSDDFFAFCRDMSFDLSRIDHEDRWILYEFRVGISSRPHEPAIKFWTFYSSIDL